MPTRIMLSEVISALSCALDLADGQPPGHTMRSCLIGMRLGMDVGLNAEDRVALYYALLLKDAGSSSNSARLCKLFGTDDRLVGPRMRVVDPQSRLAMAIATVRVAAAGRAVREKLHHVATIVRSRELMREMAALRCERGADVALRLGFAQPTAQAVLHLDEHWNGRGYPQGLDGPSIPLMSRIVNLAQTVEVFQRERGLRAARRMVRQRRGTWFDPALADRVLAWRQTDGWWARIADSDLWAEVVSQEPGAVARWVSDDDLDVVARVFADIIDAKSPYTRGHSRNVAAYGLGIARELGLDAVAQRRVYRAGLLHDIGMLGVSNSILDMPGHLDAGERVVVERHPFCTWEILSRVPAFRDFAWPAALHHERLDGSGYPWHLSGHRLDMTARIVCVADVFEALTAERPYRAGMSWEESSRVLWSGRGTQFDPAVLDALASCHASHLDMTALAPLVAA